MMTERKSRQKGSEAVATRVAATGLGLATMFTLVGFMGRNAASIPNQSQPVSTTSGSVPNAVRVVPQYAPPSAGTVSTTQPSKVMLSARPVVRTVQVDSAPAPVPTARTNASR